MSRSFPLPSFYPILDTEALAKRGLSLTAAAEALLDAGAGILQIRHKGHFSRALFAEAETMARMCREAGALPIINDRADIAALLDAGVHLGQEDLPPAAARRVVGAERIVGFSTHNAAQIEAAAAEPADYLAVGPIFTTSTKANPDPVLGLEQLAWLRGLSALPVVAIGGISLETAARVLDAGADSVAVISAMLPETNDMAALRALARRWMEETKRRRG